MLTWKFSIRPLFLQKFFSDEGIALTGPEIKSLYAAFDANNDIDGDNICAEDEIYGCLDIEAYNYNESATEEDYTCL